MKLNGNSAAFMAYGASVIGSRHIVEHRANQDAYGWRDGAEGVEVMALSDGHGGSEHDLSELGSKFAVEVALTCAQALSTDEWIQSAMDTEALYCYFEESFSQKIQACWIERVREHSEDNELKRYGCTLLMAIRWKTWLVFLQIGDGKIATVYECGKVEFPIPNDSRLVGNETFSMSQPYAWAEMKVRVMAFDQNIHTIVLASDGVENAYPNGKYDDADFYLWVASEVPSEAVVEQCLTTAERYSKDDSTAVVWRNIIKAHNLSLPSEDAISNMIMEIESVSEEVVSLAEICHCPLNKRIEMAYSFLIHLEKKQYYFDLTNTIKSVVLNAEKNDFLWRGDSKRPCDLNRIVAILNQLNLNFDSGSINDFHKLRKALAIMQRNLRYDYQNHEFYFDRSLSMDALQIEGACGPYELFSDSEIYLHQLMPLVGVFDPVVGKIVQHAKHKGVWGIKNLTDHSWVLSQGSHKWVAPNEVMPLVDGMKVSIYGIPIGIRF